MPIATMTSKGQITIPKEIRDELGLVPGTKVSFTINDHGDYVLSRHRVSAKSAYGILYREGRPPVTLEEMDEALREIPIR
jgi:AbrB family looped-hinge helix DNA binding protein